MQIDPDLTEIRRQLSKLLPFEYSQIAYHNGAAILSVHYENTPIQIYRKFHLQKLKIFR